MTDQCLLFKLDVPADEQGLYWGEDLYDESPKEAMLRMEDELLSSPKPPLSSLKGGQRCAPPPIELKVFAALHFHIVFIHIRLDLWRQN